MIRISALNDSSSSEDESATPQLTQTKEAKEAEAFAAYNKALSYQQSGSWEYAEKLLRNLIDHPFLKEAATLVETEDGPISTALVHPGLQLLYLVHKNLAAIFLQRKDSKKAMESYIEAVKIDSSEVTVWFKMGQIALKIHNYPLAKICFQQALQCNPSHWPSLDKSITVTFALGDYLMCLEHISFALERDCHYSKGLVLKKKIFSEQPSLESITKDLFSYCDPQIHTALLDEEDSREYLDECKKMQLKQRELHQAYMEKEYKPMTFLKPLAPFTWKNVGECLLELYEFATTSDPPKSLGLAVDLRDYNFLDQSIIFGKDHAEKEEKVNKQKSSSRVALRLCPKSTQQLKEQDNEFSPQGSPFQRAMEQGNANPPTTPDSLTVGNNAKESALLQRLQGREKNLAQQGSQIENSKKKVNAEKTPLSNPLADLEDMDVGNDFSEMPSLEEAMDITNLNLADIQKTDFAPDLFLKASEDDLGLGNEVKSLESVLSSVIDMELDQTPVNPPDVSNKTSGQDLEDPTASSDLPKSTGGKCEADETSVSKQTPEMSQPASELTQVTPTLASSSHKESVEQEKAICQLKPKDPKSAVISTPKHPEQTSSQTSLTASVSLPLAVSTSTVSKSEDLKLVEEVASGKVHPGQGGSSAAQYSPSHRHSIVASLLSPKIDLIKSSTASANVGTPSQISSKSDQGNNSSLYLTPSASPMHTDKTLGMSTLNEIKTGQDIQKDNSFTQSPLSGPLSKKSPTGVEKRDGQSSTSMVSMAETNLSLSSSERLSSISTGDLIENVVRRHIMGPPSTEVSPHQLSPQTVSRKLSPFASASTPTQPVASGSKSKTPPNSSPIHLLQSPTRPQDDPKHISQVTMSPSNVCPPYNIFQRSLSFTSTSKPHLSKEMNLVPDVFGSPPDLLTSQNLLRAQRSLAFMHGSPPYQGNQFLRHSLSVDAPTYLPLGKEDIPSERVSDSICLPRHHLNTLSVLDTKALLNTPTTGMSLGQSGLMMQRGSSHWRPSLARSSSLPGYLTSPLTPPFPDLQMIPGSSTPTSHPLKPPTCHNLSLLDLYPPAFYPDLSRFSSTASSSVMQKPASVLLGSPPTNLLNPFSSPAMNYNSPPSLISMTKQSTAGERKSPVSSPSTSTGSGQRQQKSPFKATSPGRHQQGHSPSHQSLGKVSPNIIEGASTQSNQNLGREDLYQAMVKSILEGSNRPKQQQETKSPTRYGSSRPEKNSPAGADYRSGPKRAPKRKSEMASLSDDWAQAYKRRSTRSRSTRTKKEVESPDFGKLMKQYFPQSLMVLKEETSEEGSSVNDSQNLPSKNSEGPEKTSKVDKALEVPALEETEEEDVKSYIKSCLRGHGLLQLIHVYLLRLGERSGHRWYPGLTDIYLRLYECLRKHLTIPTIWLGDDEDISPNRLREYAVILLTKAELSVSKIVSEHSALGSPSPSKLASCHARSKVDLFSEFHTKDICFLDALVERDDVFSQEDLTLTQFCARLYWLQARQHQALLETPDAVDFFQMVKIVLEESKDKYGDAGLVVLVPNTGSDSVISLQEVSQMMDNVQRYQSLEDTRNLYDQGEFSKVVDNLIATFNEKNVTSKPAASKERPSQLLLLLDSLHSLGRLAEVLQWGEICLNEAVLHYQRAPSLQLRQDWEATLVSLFEMIDRVMDKDNDILQSLSHHRLVRLAHNLVSVIQTVLDVADGVTEMPITSVRPWKILYRVLQFEEESVAKVKSDCSGNTREEGMDTDQSGEEGEIRPSLAMLIKSHEYLGRHSWCTKENGLLLTFIMSILGKELSAKDNDEDDDDEDASSAFEQCVYCLYNHPNKRGRARHLSDHNATPVEMSWEGAGQVFHYFAPDTIPEFDSYKTSTISSDVEHLLRKIFTLIPDSLLPGERHTATVDYIEGTSSTLPEASSPSIPSSENSTDPYKICSLIYYLLADFYFKNKEPAKAVKFYQLDVAVNSTRLDAWVGLALARMSQLMQKLNSTELKVETPVNKKSEAALRCFRRAVELDDTSRKLWLEFGSLAYQLHSHASRQIHYRNMFNISGEMLMKSRLRRTEMLDLAKESYRRANECEGDGSEDDWLTYYMMGKVAEKQGVSPKVFLDSYKQAALCLHEEEAAYPPKLQFTTLPPHLALEALEVFFRIQASSLKLVLSGCDYKCLLILDSFVTDSHEGFFARREQKQSQIAESAKSDILVPSTSKPSATAANQTPQSNKKPKKTYHKTPLDHNYSRHKSVSDSQSEGEERKDQGQPNPAQVEDMEGSSDWSQEEAFYSPKPAPEITATPVGQTTAAFGVFEISSSHTDKAEESSSSDLDKSKTSSAALEEQIVNPQKESLVSVTGRNKDTDIPMETENTETKDQTDCMETENTETKDKTDDTGEPIHSSKENKALIVEGEEKREDNEAGKTLSESAARNIAMETDTVAEDVLMKISSDHQASAKDTELPSKEPQLKESCQTEQPEKSSAERQVSLGFTVTNKENKETADACEKQEKENNVEQEMEEDIERPVETPEDRQSSVILTDKHKNVRTDEENSSIGENMQENVSEEKHLSSELISVKDKEKWETEDQEKSTVKDTSDASSIVDPTSASSLVASGAAQSEEPACDKEPVSVSEADREKLRSDVRQKCIAGLELCSMRFSCHYKSLYRLAHAYYVMKEYSKARDLLLGCSDWQQQPHMPAPGLFSERKQNNLFQGLWKIPIEDIDRSGSFASHVHRSVQLLLNVLADQGDLDMLLQIRNQLRRTPDAGKKYLRDSERLVLAEEAYNKCLSSVERTMERGDSWSESRREDNLLTVYRVWSVGKGGRHGFDATRMLHMAFKLMMKGRTDVNRLTPEQAILYCNQNLSKLLTPVTPSQSQALQKSVAERVKQSQGQTPTGPNLEKQEKAKPRHEDPKDEDLLNKTDSTIIKVSIASDADKQEIQPTYKAISESLLSQPQQTSRVTPTPSLAPPVAVSSTAQQDEDVIVISDPE